ncbi:MAG: hypothetical protein G01um10147_799 [Microgenomates group bacterium Gr01-1014_7]|nr:MAG: hypothetical protein G01um10147_799 [Microgenomates group bacterium Gr01-1014_7]
MEEKQYLTEDEAKELPFIPLPKELESLPLLPKEQEETMRTLARHAISIMLERYRNDPLKTSSKRPNVEVRK